MEDCTTRGVEAMVRELDEEEEFEDLVRQYEEEEEEEMEGRRWVRRRLF